MGKRIPGKKHRGVNDPHKQQQVRFDKVKSKINAPPSDPDFQDTPKSLLEIMHLKDKAKALKTGKKLKTKKKSNSKKMPRLDRDGKVIPVFEPSPNEPEWRFMRRVNNEVESIIREHKFEEKFKVNIQRNRETGRVTGVEKKKKHEVDTMLKKLQKESKKGKKPAKEGRMTKSQKRVQKLKERKQRRQDTKESERVDDEFKNTSDPVQFGEVAHAPPSLTLPKAPKDPVGRKPAKKDLLLNQLINKQNEHIAGTQSAKQKVANSAKKPLNNGKIDRKGKRKHLPQLLRKQLDKQRDEIVKMYKNLKNNKNV